MTKKSLDGSISMGMSSGSPRTSPFFRLLSAPELNCLPSQPLYSFLHLLEYSTRTIVVLFLLHWLSSMLSLQELLGILQPLSTVS
jgi:hypothetical protein